MIPVRRHCRTRRVNADKEILSNDKNHAEDLRESKSEKQAEPEDLSAPLHIARAEVLTCKCHRRLGKALAMSYVKYSKFSARDEPAIAASPNMLIPLWINTLETEKIAP